MTRMTRRTVLGSALALGVSSGTRAQLCNSGPETWVEAAALPVRTQEIYPAALDGRIYLAGGLSPDAGDGPIGILDRAFVWTEDRDAATRIDDRHCLQANAWQAIAPLPEPRHHPNLVAHDGAVFAVGGFRAGGGGAWSMIDTCTRYDPASDSWTEMAPMPAPYGETVAMSLATGLHVVTGRQPAGEANAQWTDHADSARHYVYDAHADRWIDARPNPHARNSAAGGVISGRLHVVGGRTVGGGNATHHEAYDPVSDTWQALAPLPQGQGGLAAAVSRGRLFAFGGEWFGDGTGGVFAETWVYDPGRDLWSAGPPMRTPRHGLGGVAIDDRIFSVAGATGYSARGTSGLMEVLLP